MSDNDNNMNMYWVNNNSSSSSISSMGKDVFTQILIILGKYRIDKEMKNDENDKYYAIISQPISRDYGGDILTPHNKISEDVINIVNKLKDEVKIFNDNNKYNKGVFHLSQPLANLYGEIIIIIDYSDKLIQTNIPKFNDNILFNYILFSAKLQTIIPFKFEEFQDKL
jgi:hypothetical protein